jgi:hypothetical protein
VNEEEGCNLAEAEIEPGIEGKLIRPARRRYREKINKTSRVIVEGALAITAFSSS